MKSRFDRIAEEKLNWIPTPNTQCQDCAFAEVPGRGFRPDLGICQIYNDYPSCNYKPGGVLRGLEPCEHYKKKPD